MDGLTDEKIAAQKLHDTVISELQAIHFLSMVEDKTNPVVLENEAWIRELMGYLRYAYRKHQTVLAPTFFYKFARIWGMDELLKITNPI